MNEQKNQKNSLNKLLLLSLGAIGVVYGDIGTSPLYTINEIMFGRGKFIHSAANILGCISLVIWALTIVVSIKYIIFVLRADSDGEGGVFALYSLLSKKSSKIIMMLLILAAGLLLGDGMITPAISILSAVEGLKVATSTFEPFIIPITIIVLTLLFAYQSKGTHTIGKIFGPVISLWFIIIGFFGAVRIFETPHVLQAINPWWALQFVFHQNFITILLVLGSVMLALTGGEAMYADLGHFGKKPIRLGWFLLVYPSLLLNYMGQGAYLLSGNKIIFGNIFYSLIPHAFLYPVVILATLATIIASQALISGAFSLMSQAFTLGLIPYLSIIHTHPDHEGQIYIPAINWALYIGCLFLVLIFRSSNNLASAYGLAVSGVMIMTSISLFDVSFHYWHWSRVKTILIFVPLTLIDLIFLVSNSLKFFEGGFIPLCIGVLILGLMLIWKWGRQKVHNKFDRYPSMSVKELIGLKQKVSDLNTSPHSVVILTGRCVTSINDKVPVLKQIIWERYKSLSKHIILLNVMVKKLPHIKKGERFQIYKLYEDSTKGSITGVQINFGFMEEADVESVLGELAKKHLVHIPEDHRQWVIEAMHERIYLKTVNNIFDRVRFTIFKLISRNTDTADQYYRLGNKTKLSIEVFPMYF